MRVTREMQFMSFDDIGAFAQARMLVRMVKEIAAAAPVVADPGEVDHLAFCATMVASILAEGLRANDAEHEVQRLRLSKRALHELRQHAYQVFAARWMSGPMFDELMVTSARCLTEVGLLEVGTRRRVIARIEQRQTRFDECFPLLVDEEEEVTCPRPVRS